MAGEKATAANEKRRERQLLLIRARAIDELTRVANAGFGQALSMALQVSGSSANAVQLKLSHGVFKNDDPIGWSENVAEAAYRPLLEEGLARYRAALEKIADGVSIDDAITTMGPTQKPS